MRVKKSSVKWRQFCLGGDEFIYLVWPYIVVLIIDLDSEV